MRDKIRVAPRGPDFVYAKGAFYLNDISGWVVCRTVEDFPLEWRVFTNDGRVAHTLNREEMDFLLTAMGAKNAG